MFNTKCTNFNLVCLKKLNKIHIIVEMFAKL